MKEFEKCTLYGMIGNATEEQRGDIVEYLCEPSCNLECPVKLPILEFTGDGVVPYIEKWKE